MSDDPTQRPVAGRVAEYTTHDGAATSPSTPGPLTRTVRTRQHRPPVRSAGRSVLTPNRYRTVPVETEAYENGVRLVG